jgi:hypothetical protein
MMFLLSCVRPTDCRTLPAATLGVRMPFKRGVRQ